MKTNELTDLHITHVSYVRKGANKQPFFLMKSDDSKPAYEREIDIFISKADDPKKLVYGVVYEPDAIDTHGEFAKAEEIEKAAHQFLTDYRNIDLQHNFEPGIGEVKECYLAPTDFTKGTKAVKKGSWVLVTKASDEVWDAIQKGEITGYSMAGRAKRVETAKKADETEIKNEKEVSKETAAKADSELGSFFNAMKSFFTGSKLEKADSAAQVKTFAQRMAVNDVMDKMWKVTDALTETMRQILANPDIKDKNGALNSAVDEFAEYMKKRIADADCVGVKKDSEGLFSEFVEKAGKAISAANMQKIKEAHTALDGIISLTENQDDEGDVEKMNITEVTDLIKEQLKPLAKEIEELKKQDADEVESDADTGEGTDTLTKEDVEKIVLKAVEPVISDIKALKKARGISRQEQGSLESGQVKKSIFGGIDI